MTGGPETGGEIPFTPTGRPGDLEMDIRNGVGDAIEGLHQERQSLARLHGPDGEDVRRFRVVAGHRRPQWREPIVDHVDAVGVDAERGQDLIGHGLGDHVDGRTLTQRPADQCGVPQRRRAAEFGEADGSQVVHRDEPRRPGGRRHDEVGAVHHVDGAGPSLDRGVVEARPGPEAQGGRDRDRPSGTDRIRQPLRQRSSTRGAEAIPDDIDSAVARHRREKAGDGCTHTRAHSQQWRGIHGHHDRPVRVGHLDTNCRERRRAPSPTGSCGSDRRWRSGAGRW